MKRFCQTIGAASVGLLLWTGCATTGLSVRERGGRYPAVIHGLVRSRTNAPPARNVQLPLRVAVGQLGETAPSKALMEKLNNAPHVIASASPIPFPGQSAQSPYYARNGRAANEESSQGEQAIETGRRLAAEMGADYLMVVGGNIDSYSKPTALVLLNATIIGGAIVPSTQLRAEGKGAGALIDVVSGQIVSMINTDARGTKMAPSYFEHEYRTGLELKLRDQLLQQLGDELIQQLGKKQIAQKN